MPSSVRWIVMMKRAHWLRVLNFARNCSQLDIFCLPSASVMHLKQPAMHPPIENLAASASMSNNCLSHCTTLCFARNKSCSRRLRHTWQCAEFGRLQACTYT